MSRRQNSSLVKMVAMLNDGQCHDGTLLGERLGMTRSAVWKAIKKLRQNHIAIESIKGKGYILKEPLLLLDEALIKKALQPHRVSIFESIESTQQYVGQDKTSRSVEVCLAEEQTRGRGRWDRHWASPFAQNLYFSLRYPFNKDVGELSGLSLVVGLALVVALELYGFEADFKVKWPNDVLVQGKKLAGVLIDIHAESHGQSHAVIGVGLNVNMMNAESMNRPWTSLRMLENEYINRTPLFIHIFETLLTNLKQFEDMGFSSFITSWLKVDALFDQVIDIAWLNKTIRGKAVGITEQGYLKVQQENGENLIISSGDATLASKEKG